MNYNEHIETYEFLDSLASNPFIPLILQPTRITGHSNTLIDMFSNHLPQFAIIPNIFGNNSGIINLIFMKGTGPNLIEKILSQTSFLLTGKICRKLNDEPKVGISTKVYLMHLLKYQ